MTSYRRGLVIIYCDLEIGLVCDGASISCSVVSGVWIIGALRKSDSSSVGQDAIGRGTDFSGRLVANRTGSG